MLINNESRNKLNEGRNTYMGFAFCKKTDKGFETIQPISPCKDYLNDVVYSEHTGKPVSVYGLSTKKQNIFDDNYAYIAIKMYDSGIEELENNIQNVTNFINKFEENEFTSIEKCTDGMYLLTVPKKWVNSTWKISVYSLLLRNAINYNGEDVWEYLTSNKIYKPDKYLLNLKYVKFALEDNSKQDFSKLTSNYSVHNYGLQTHYNTIHK